MYSEEEMIYYVERMWAEGLTPTAASKKWGGLPSRVSLCRWAYLAERGMLDAKKPAIYGTCPPHQKHAHYPALTREVALRRVHAGEKPADVARSLNIESSAPILRWLEFERKQAKMSLPQEKKVSSKKGTSKMSQTKPDIPEIDDLRQQVEELSRELAEQSLQTRVLMELMRDPKVDALGSLSNRQLTVLGEKLRKEFGCSLKTLLNVLNMSKSTYEYNRKKILEEAPASQSEDDDFDRWVLHFFEQGKRTYGYRRVRAQMLLNGICAPEWRVRASMRRQRLLAHNTRCVRTYKSYNGKLDVGICPNLFCNDHGRRNFTASAPNQKWVTDVTEVKASNGRLFISVLLDCFDGRAVSWSVSRKPDAVLTDETLTGALGVLEGDERPILHSDRGMLYQGRKWIEACAGKVERSMSKKATPADNALCEAFFGHMKAEFYHPLEWDSLTIDDLMGLVDDYLVWYDSERLKAFRDPDGKIHYETIDGRRERLGLRV